MARTKSPGWNNPRVVDTYSVLTKLRMLRSFLQRVRDVKRRGGVGTDQFPATVQVQTHNECTSRCRVCPHQESIDLFGVSRMERALYDKIADECAREPNLAAFSLVLQNEPLMDADLFDEVRYFQDQNRHDVIVFIVTNGTLLTDARAEELLASGLDMMHISVNGWGKEDFEYVNRGKNFDAFMANLNNFLDKDLSRTGVNLSFIMNRKYEREVNQAVAYWRGRGMRVHVHGLSNRGGMVSEDTLREFGSHPDHEPWRTRLLKKLAGKLVPCCPYPFFQASILATGQLLLCTHDWARKGIVGDLNQTTLREAWNGEAMNELRMMHLQGRAKEIPACRDCTVVENLAFV